MTAVGVAVDWLFRDRTTGAIVIGQRPNAPLLAFAACAGLGLVVPARTPALAIRILGTACLACWAVDEIARGANPWRRGLGAAVLGWQAYGILAAP